MVSYQMMEDESHASINQNIFYEVWKEMLYKHFSKGNYLNHCDYFFKRCVGGRRCHECGDLVLFHRKFPIDPTHPGLSDITVKWKRYEYVSMNPSSSSHVPSKKINLLEDEIPISYFMEKFQSKIYKYIKHSHGSRWQALEFKHSCEVFEPGTNPIGGRLCRELHICSSDRDTK